MPEGNPGLRVRDRVSCSICGAVKFETGPLNRLGRNGMPPQCAKCGCLERHRILRILYDAIPDEVLANRKALQFSYDGAVPQQRFQSFEVSIFGGENSLDLMDLVREDATYEWLIANHVLSAIPDDRRAIAEIFRVLGRDGVVQLCDPDPESRIDTWDWGFPDGARHNLYRLYGSDFGLRVSRVVQDATGIAICGTDPVTDGREIIYFFSRDVRAIRQLAKAFIAEGHVVWRSA